MNFYLDFEATRFSNRIISIGCIAENGDTFSTLVNPGPKKKVDKFITELTGITNEMLETAPSADDAFYLLYLFILKNYDNEAPAYYVYGNSDIDFIKATLKGMKNPASCMCAQAIAGSLIDYAEVVKEFFVAKSDLALRKVYMLIQDQQELVQKHDALEDAKMLETVVSQLYDKCKPEDKETIMAIPSQKRPKVPGAPEIFYSWNAVSKWEAITGADKNNWILKGIDQHSGQIVYFNDFDTAALWIIKYIARNVSPKNQGHIDKIKSAISSACQSNKCRYNCFWEYSAENAIAVTAKKEDK